MSNTHKQVDYDRIARKMDGESVRLNPQEQEIFMEIISAEHEVLANLNVAVPVGAVERATKRATAALAKPGKAPRLLFGFGVTIGIAAAAAIVISSIVSVLHQSNQYNPNPMNPDSVRVVESPIDQPQINDSIDFNHQKFFDNQNKSQSSEQDNIFDSSDKTDSNDEEWINTPGQDDHGVTEL